MAPREKIEEVFTENGELQLWKCGRKDTPAYEIIINGVFIMASYNSDSSKRLITSALKRMDEGTPLSVLIGGLGMGFTLREACRHERIRHIDVVEMEPVIVRWNETHFDTFKGACRQGERVRLRIGDFYRFAMAGEHAYDLVSIDIDNGPMLLVNEGNERVYTPAFLKVIRGVLKPGGVCVIWSCGRDRVLEESLQAVFGAAEIEEVTERFKGRDVAYYLYFGKKRD